MILITGLIKFNVTVLKDVKYVKYTSILLKCHFNNEGEESFPISD